MRKNNAQPSRILSMQNNSRRNLVIVVVIASLIWGFLLGHAWAGLKTDYSCLDMSRFHRAFLIREYGVDENFDTDTTSPRHEINQRASDLHSKFLEICYTDPRK